MSYCTLTDIIASRGADGEQELIELTDASGAGVIDEAVVDRAILSADSVINSYLGVRYALPLASTPPIVNTHAVAIVMKFLYAQRATEQVKADHDEAIRWLKDVATGKATLGLDAGSEATATDSVRYEEAGSPVFNSETLADF